MWVWHRHLLTLALVLAALTLTSGAYAWLETSIRSDAVTIDLERDGSATVAHELLMKVRGGPMRTYVLDGIDSDAELLPDGTVSRARSGRGAATPIPLLLHKNEDGSLRIEIDRTKGLGRGTYLFRFRYRTDLLERDLIQQDGMRVALRWIGPRFADGIDSARVVFRLPQAKLPPQLPTVDSSRLELGLADDPGGVFLSNLRSAHDKDELEVVRPHIAKGEPVVWRIQADARAFAAFSAAAEPPSSALLLPDDAPTLPRQRALLIVIAVGIALLYGSLVVIKWALFAKSCRIRDARPRAVVPLPAALRAALAGAALAGAAGVAVFTEHPTLAGGLLVLAMVLAALRSPCAAPPLRGPGQWQAVSDEAGFARSAPSLPGRFLDTGSVLGFVLFAAGLLGFAYGALRLVPTSPFHALLLVLASASLVPLFCTGRASELPPDPATGPRRLLAFLAKRLRREAGLQATAWARVPVGGQEPDELRLLVLPARPLEGLTGIEVGQEYQYGGGGPVALPYALIRVQDASPSYNALAPHVSFMRGRNGEERVAVLRPKLPTRRMILALVRRLTALLTDHSAARARPSRQSLPRAA